LVSELFGLLAEGREIPLELEVGGLQPLLPDLSLARGLVPFLASPPVDLVDLCPELLLSGHARPQGGVKAISIGAECFQLVRQPGHPHPIRFSVLEFGVEPIPLCADLLQFLRGGLDRPKFDAPELGRGDLMFSLQDPFEVSGVGRLVPQLLDLGTQPTVLRSESLQLIVQSLRLPELALDSLELLLKVMQPALGLGESLLRLGEPAECGFILGCLCSPRGANPLWFTLLHRAVRLVRLGRSRRTGFAGGRWSGWGDCARIMAQSGAKLLAAMLAEDLATEVDAPDPQVAPVAMGAGDPKMLGRSLRILRGLDHRGCLGCW
jgi:hypothetical protein